MSDAYRLFRFTITRTEVDPDTQQKASVSEQVDAIAPNSIDLWKQISADIISEIKVGEHMEVTARLDLSTPIERFYSWAIDPANPYPYPSLDSKKITRIA